MVQLLSDPAVSPNEYPSRDGQDALRLGAAHGPSIAKAEGGGMSREEHALRMRELHMKRGMMRAPRRGWSMTDYQGDNQGQVLHASAAYVDKQASIPENAPLSTPATTPPVNPAQPAAEMPASEQKNQLPRRPKLPPPRRSYSVMDYEPVPHGLPKPSGKLGILDLPPELHYTLFDFLDPIDGVCLGLTHSSLYTISKRKYGKVPLSSRYSGPNDMEWAWRGAGPLVHMNGQRREQPGSESEISAEARITKEKQLEQLRVKGQVYCRKCGISRCELHRHLKEWMGPNNEYCEIRKMYGPHAPEDAKSYCFMSSPKNPYRCGRHGGKKMTS